MKKKIETKNDGQEFERFENLVRNIIKVPKSEIDRREKEWKKERAKQAKKKA
jgi:hypothetical protein